MRLRDKLALSVAPILLRVLLGLVFLWVGLGKVVDRIPVSGDDAVILTQLGAFEADDGETVRRLNEDALLIYRGANPAPDDAGRPRASTWPSALAGGNAPVVLAWTGALVAIVGGSMMLVGLLTRLWAAVLMLSMIVVLWLAQLGPAIQTGQTTMGIFPDRPLFNPAEWHGVIWPFSLFMAAMTLVLAGPGAYSLDRAIFGKGG
jgi:uncharacterized membrane protein YphA (DoxX/SURF4 family)